jgi:ABC-type molybdate transport system ATPase subunit
MLPGEMLALMGPSGSGKTSLLSIISGRAPKAVTTSGRVTSNGARFTKAAKRRVGFVLQDDLLYEVRRSYKALPGSFWWMVLVCLLCKASCVKLAKVVYCLSCGIRLLVS